MLQNSKKISDLVYQDAVKMVAEQHCISLEESKAVIKKMTFLEYLQLTEAPIVPPSQAAPVGSQPSQPATGQQPATPQTAGQAGQKTPWDGKGAIQQGMTVTYTNPQTGKDEEAEVSHFDQATGGVTLKTALGQQQIYNKANLKSPQAMGQQVGGALAGAAKTVAGAVKAAPGAASTSFQQGMQAVRTAEDIEISRLQELAGIQETSSGGSTSAGCVASAPNVVGDTAHRPSDKLGHKLRLKKLKKKKE